MIFRLSLLAAAAVAALAVSQVNTDSSRKQNSSNTKHSVKKSSSLQQIEAEEEEKFTEEKSQPKEEAKRVKRKMKQDLEKELLHNLGTELVKRKLILERKLLELYGLKEQQSYIAQLRRDLDDKMKMIDMLNGATDSLQDEVKNLQAEMRQTSLANSQLEMAMETIEKLKMKMDCNASNVRQRLLMLEQQMSRFHSNKDPSVSDCMNVKEHNAARKVELELVEMQRMNKELELEKRRLSVKLLDAQARIKSLSIMKEDKIVSNIEEEISTLKHTNEGLSKEVERMQMNRFNMVEELVYQRWLNTCLRFETQNYQTPSRRTSSSDISNNGSIIISHMKADQPVLDPSFDSISSLTSSTDSNEIDSCSTTESSSNSQRSITKKFGLMRSIKKWGRSKDDSSSNASSPDNPHSRISVLGRTGLIRRHSTSVIPSSSSELSSKDENTTTSTQSRKKVKQESTEEPQNMPALPQARRVSFCDSVKTFNTTYQDAPKSVEEVTDKKQISTQKSGKSSGKLAYPSDSSANTISNDRLDDEVGREIGTAQTEKLHSSVSVNLTTAALLLLLFILLVCFLLLTKL